MSKWIKATIFVVWLVMLCQSTVMAEVKEEWVARYDGPGNHSDYAHAIAVDGAGNVYITGTSSSHERGHSVGHDYATVKYDAKGNELWVKRYNGPANSAEWATAIAVDGDGNVYVTGRSDSGYIYNGGTDFDYATVKYDTNGNELWVKRYNGSENSYDIAHAIAVDSSGNVYVTGSSRGKGTGRGYYATVNEFATVKYDTKGNELWVKRYSGPENIHDGANAIALDAAGNVYVSGYSYGRGTGSDYATVKYDTKGNELWAKKYNGMGNNDYARGIVVDGPGNVYITGDSYGRGTGSDYATVKYDTKGNELWTKRYNGTGNDHDHVKGIVVDGSGNVYVTGNSFNGSIYSGGTSYDYATVKYDSKGNELWVKRYDGLGNSLDGARAIALDEAGNVYVTGRSDNESIIGSDYTTIKYDTNGNESWVTRYSGPVNGANSASDIAVDGSGNVYITGQSFGIGAQHDYATVKYSQAPTSPSEVTVVVAQMVESGYITSVGVANAITSSLDNAQKNLETSPVSARNMLEATIKKIEAQADKKITTEAAQQLIKYLNNIIANL